MLRVLRYRCGLRCVSSPQSTARAVTLCEENITDCFLAIGCYPFIRTVPVFPAFHRLTRATLIHRERKRLFVSCPGTRHKLFNNLKAPARGEAAPKLNEAINEALENRLNLLRFYEAILCRFLSFCRPTHSLGYQETQQMRSSVLVFRER